MSFHGLNEFFSFENFKNVCVTCTQVHVCEHRCSSKGPARTWCASQRKTSSLTLSETVSSLFATVCDKLGGPRGEETPGESPASTSHLTVEHLLPHLDMRGAWGFELSSSHMRSSLPTEPSPQPPS